MKIIKAKIQSRQGNIIVYCGFEQNHFCITMNLGDGKDSQKIFEYLKGALNEDNYIVALESEIDDFGSRAVITRFSSVVDFVKCIKNHGLSTIILKIIE